MDYNGWLMFQNSKFPLVGWLIDGLETTPLAAGNDDGIPVTGPNLFLPKGHHWLLPSGKCSHNFGKIHHFSWKQKRYFAIVNSYVKHCQRVNMQPNDNDTPQYKIDIIVYTMNILDINNFLAITRE